MGGEKRNVVLITVDSVRADHCGFLNPVSNLTPNLDALADEGTVFENAIAPGPRTPTSVPETLTGAAMAHEAADSHSEQVTRISTHLENHPTLPEQLSESGYTTVAYNSNPWMSAQNDFAETFDEFVDVGFERDTLIQRWLSDSVADTKVGDAVFMLDQWYHKRGFFSMWTSFADDLFETIRDLPKPYFLWVFLLDTHNPYFVPPEYRVESSTVGMYYGLFRGNALMDHSSNQSAYRSNIPPHVRERILRAYRDAIRSVDGFVGKLVAETRGDDPVVAFHSDHGEAFGEHGTYGHRQALFEENVHVPLLVHGTEDENARVSRPISLRTLPELLTSYVEDGMSVSSDRWTDPYVVTRSESGDKVAVRSEEYKYVRTPNGEKLFDLDDDPDEMENLVNHDIDVTRFRERAAEYLHETRKSEIEGRNAKLSESLEQRLSMLGYRE